MALPILLFVFSVLLLWLSSDLLTRKIEPIADYFRVNELIVTVLGVSVFSSLPELTLSAFAIARGNSELSLGNVIGSNFVTLTFVTAVCAFIRPIDIHHEVKDRESSWMILSSSIVLVLSQDRLLSRLDGLILILLYVPYMVTVIRAALREARAKKIQTERVGRRQLVVNLGLALLAVVGIIFSSKAALDNGEKLGLALGIPALALGVILFALGIWTFAYGLRWTTTDLQMIHLWLNLTYLGIVLTPAAVLVFTFQYTEPALKNRHDL